MSEIPCLGRLGREQLSRPYRATVAVWCVRALLSALGRWEAGLAWWHGAISTGCPRARASHWPERRWAGGGYRGARSRPVHHEALAEADRELRAHLVPIQRRGPPPDLQAAQRARAHRCQAHWYAQQQHPETYGEYPMAGSRETAKTYDNHSVAMARKGRSRRYRVRRPASVAVFSGGGGDVAACSGRDADTWECSIAAGVLMTNPQMSRTQAVHHRVRTGEPEIPSRCCQLMGNPATVPEKPSPFCNRSEAT